MQLQARKSLSPLGTTFFENPPTPLSRKNGYGLGSSITQLQKPIKAT